MNNDSRVAFELSLLMSNIKKELCGMLNSFLSFLGKYEKKKVHHLFFLILDSRFKSLFSFIGHEQNFYSWRVQQKIIISYACEILSSFTSIDK